MSNIESNVKRKPNVLMYVIAFVIPVATILIYMATHNCYPFGTGENTVILEDLQIQYYGYYSELIDRIKSGGSLLYSWNSGLGENFYVSFFYYLANPFTWIALLLGSENLYLSVILILLLHVGFCSVTACYYFAHTELNKMVAGPIRTTMCILFATAYGMCDYINAYQYNIIWLSALLFMPLVLLGIERLVSRGETKLYTIALFLTFVANFYFSWFICIFAVIWFIDRSEGDFKNRLKSFGRFAVSSIISALSAAAVLVPCYIQALSRNDSNWYSLSDFSTTFTGSLGDFITGFFWGYDFNTNGTVVFTNNNYCGLFVLFLVGVYAFSKNGSKSHKIKRLATIIALCLAANWIVTVYVLHGFSIPHCFFARFAFILFFILIITAFEGVQHIWNINAKQLAVIFLLSIAGLVAAVLLTTEDSLQDAGCYLVTICVFSYLIICAVLYLRKSIKYTSLLVNILIIGFAELVSNYLYVTSNWSNQLERDSFDYNEWVATYNDISTEDGQRKTSLLSDYAIFFASDSDMFSSSISSAVLQFYDAVGLSGANNGGEYYFRGTTPLTAALLNVDYVLTDMTELFSGYVGEANYYTSSGIAYGVYTTDYDAELCFMLPSDVLDWDVTAGDVFEVQNSFTSDVLGVGDIFEKYDVEYEETANALTISSLGDLTYSYSYSYESFLSYPIVEVSFTVDEAADLYVHASDDNVPFLYVYVDDEQIAMTSRDIQATTLHIGYLESGQEVTVGVLIKNASAGTTGTLSFDIYSYNDDVMQECLEILNEEPLEITTFTDTYVKGTVTAEEDEVLYTSIPYYKGWSVYVDGVKTDISLVGNAFIAVELEAGEHVVEFKYFPYGLRLGIILTIVGLVCMSFWCGFIRRRGNEVDREEA